MTMQQHAIAARAAAAVSGVTGRTAKERSEYLSFCEGFPALLRNAGLLQSVLFLEAKGKHPHSTLLVHLQEQFIELGLLPKGSKIEQFAAYVAKLPAGEYMTWTRMADLVAYWQKRFAQALLKERQPAGAGTGGTTAAESGTNGN